RYGRCRLGCHRSSTCHRHTPRTDKAGTKLILDEASNLKRCQLQPSTLVLPGGSIELAFGLGGRPQSRRRRWCCHWRCQRRNQSDFGQYDREVPDKPCNIAPPDDEEHVKPARDRSRRKCNRRRGRGTLWRCAQ
ncbi:hypothetical protein SPRG_20414, partial [Saprolegnia parasitica CBS 223.65]